MQTKEMAQACLDLFKQLDRENKWETCVLIVQTGFPCFEPWLKLPNPDFDREYAMSIPDGTDEVYDKKRAHQYLEDHRFCTLEEFWAFLNERFPEELTKNNARTWQK